MKITRIESVAFNGPLTDLCLVRVYTDIDGLTGRLRTLVTDPEALVVAVQLAPTAEEVEAETEEAEAEAGVVRDEKSAAES